MDTYSGIDLSRDDEPMRVILVDPVDEITVHSIAIEQKGDNHRAEEFYRKAVFERGHEIDRILVSSGFSRFMEIHEKIPMPPVKAIGSMGTKS